MQRLKENTEAREAKTREDRPSSEVEKFPFLTEQFKLPGGSGSYYSLGLLRTPSGLRKLGWWLLGIFGLLVAAMFLPWQQNIQAQGEVTALMPGERPQTVNAQLSGQIAEWYIQEGQMVQKGDSLLRIIEVKDKYFDPKMLDRIQEQINAKENGAEASRDKIAALTQQYNALKEGLEFSLQKARNKVRQNRLKVTSDSIDLKAAQTNLRIAEQRFARQERLFKQGLKSKTDLEKRELKLQETQAKAVSAQNKLETSRQALINAKVELSSLRAEYADKMSKALSDRASAKVYLNDLESQLAKLRNRFSNMEVRTAYRIIRAPQDGYAVKAMKQGVGEIVKAGDPILRVVPRDAQLATEIYIRDTDVPLVHPGDKVRLQFDGWPALQFSGWPSVAVGTFGGEVRMVDRVNTTGDMYRVLVVQDPSEPAWPEQLRMGSGVFGWMMLDEVPLWYEIWRQLNGFPPSLQNQPGKGKGKEGMIKKTAPKTIKAR